MATNLCTCVHTGKNSLEGVMINSLLPTSLCCEMFNFVMPPFFVPASDEDDAAKLLIDAGASVNSKNLRGATPLIIAAVKGHYSVLRILANHPNIQLHEQVHQVTIRNKVVSLR